MILPVYRTFTIATNYLNIFTGESGITYTSTPMHPPRALTVSEGTVNGNAPGASKTWGCQFGTTFDGAPVNGSAVSVVDPATEARATMGATFIVGTTGDAGATVEGNSNQLIWTVTAGATQSENMMAFAYEDTADAAVEYHGWGSYGDNIMLSKSAATDYYTTFGIGGSTTLTTTKAHVQMVWPSSGAFRYCSVVYSTSGGGAVTLKQQIDGADSGFSFTLTGGVAAKTLVTDLTTMVSISAGQTVGWRINQADTASLTCAVITGFVTS